MDNELGKTAEAVAEVAKLGAQALQSGERLGGFLDRVFGDLVTDAVGVVGDRVRYLRWERQVRLADRAQSLLDSRKVLETRPVPPKVALPLLEAATIELDDDLQNLWAQLLANAMDPTFELEIRPALVEMLRSLSALDVQLLATMYEALREQHVTVEQLAEFHVTRERVMEVAAITAREYYLSIYNLFRVQCVTPAFEMSVVRSGKVPITIYRGAEAVSVTPLGWELAAACFPREDA